jgi:hypothetical protein
MDRSLDGLNEVCFLNIPQCIDRDKELKKGDEDPWGCHPPHPLSNPGDDGGSLWPSAECNEPVTALLLPMTQHKTMQTKNRNKGKKMDASIFLSLQITDKNKKRTFMLRILTNLHFYKHIIQTTHP